jgi:hypothetical protein
MDSMLPEMVVHFASSVNLKDKKKPKKMQTTTALGTKAEATLYFAILPVILSTN